MRESTEVDIIMKSLRDIEDGFGLDGMSYRDLQLMAAETLRGRAKKLIDAAEILERGVKP